MNAFFFKYVLHIYFYFLIDFKSFINLVFRILLQYGVTFIKFLLEFEFFRFFISDLIYFGDVIYILFVFLFLPGGL
jgi:hypothetical protein